MEHTLVSLPVGALSRARNQPGIVSAHALISSVDGAGSPVMSEQSESRTPGHAN